MIKAVFFDIDGTLLSFKTHLVPESTEKAIRELQSRGIKVIISTGRSINSLDHIRYLNFDGFITFNGGYCVTKDDEVLFRKPIPQEDIESLLNYAMNNEPVSFSLMSENEISIFHVTPDIQKMYDQLNLPVPMQRNYDNFDKATVLQTNIFIQPDAEEDFMRTIMPNSIASRWTPLFADVNPVGQSKKVGIDVFVKHFGLELHETMSFGDGGNDITMLAHTHIGVAMGNANPEVKAIADYITDDVDNNGIWNALKHYEII
ncbi:Putative bifunctional phosphatase/peptidyl-prolyl cis-trans isomerase [Sphingobacterium spiritivorum]|uniref:Bifunctional phosphatase/peptidyl-prolyl cis-trans isomerase n=1 Tax=Sphingobacterium spiritivorum TaxID=258 RepID=A0A380BJJ7_SPHSI|nr:Cof-type HAD-IIB family hydrolase [Sphingobacterium spiritivorum]SUJ01605.1 Putative bifunctional phosphatase/peptidyl-prolyl cis-trans isomerase [Sphingobacterium spiritivorum]